MSVISYLALEPIRTTWVCASPNRTSFCQSTAACRTSKFSLSHSLPSPIFNSKGCPVSLLWFRASSRVLKNLLGMHLEHSYFIIYLAIPHVFYKTSRMQNASYLVWNFYFPHHNLGMERDMPFRALAPGLVLSFRQPP